MAGQLITIRMNRGDSSPWGFRLQGGKDWGTPLVVSKVNPGSLADKGGLLVGDYLIKIGNQSTENMVHHEAQDAIKLSNNNLDLQVQRGSTSTWKPSVSLVGDLPRAHSQGLNEPVLVTKTSLAANPKEERYIGSAYNAKPKPFSKERIPALVHKQFNSPLNLYSMENIRETLQAHTEQLAPGVLGINFMKPDAPVNRESAVYKAILEEEQNQRADNFANQYDSNHESFSPSTQSHAFRRIQQALDHNEAPLSNQAGMQMNSSRGVSTPINKGIKDTGKIGLGNTNSGPKTLGSPRITSMSQSGRPSSPSLPWNNQTGVHHVETCSSPRIIPNSTPSSVPPPVAPKPQLNPSTDGHSPSIYQSHPYSGSLGDRDVSGGSKFTWPPPKMVPFGINSGVDSSVMNSNMTSFRTSGVHGIQNRSFDNTKINSDARATLSSVLNSDKISGPSATPGSRPAPKRGRGQLKPQVGPGSRIPVCFFCSASIRGPYIVGLGKSWCPDHFKCANTTCRKSLEQTGFVEEKGDIYCENCFESYFAPMCSKCQSRIKGSCLMALEKQWHPECFVCAYCKVPFGNNQFYMEDGVPYCERDWNELFTTKCVSCGFPIEAGDRWVEALNNNYHSNCFKCTTCSKNLEGQNFYAKGGRPFCKSHARG